MRCASRFTAGGLIGLAIVLLAATPSFAQFGFPGGGFGGGGFPGGGFGGLGGGGLGAGGNFGGVLIDPDGVVATAQPKRIAATVLRKQREEFIAEKLPPQMVADAPRRTISLRAIEAQIIPLVQANAPFPEPLVYLGGLTRIDHVIIDREAQDVLLSGPAEGFAPDDQGRRLGLKSGRPVLNLEDLIAALRARAAGNRSIGCSIDPIPENMQKLQNYLRHHSSPTTASRAAARYREMDDILGNQQVSVWGVPLDTHLARVLVEADLRMKRISMGLEPSGVRGIRSHLSLLTPQGNSLQRWWFVPFYEPIKVNAGRSVFEISGQRARLLAQEEVADASGNRSDAVSTRASTERFAQLFTQHFPQLADTSPPFAELQSAFDMAIVAALLEGEDVLNAPGWPTSTLIGNESIRLTSYHVPKYVRSSSTFRKVTGGLLIGLVGGVTVNVDRTLAEMQPAALPAPTAFRAADTAAGSWWWNADPAAE